MSLITRCPACETLFKVVPDQLRISEGWVRCGRCDEIFDASLHLLQTSTDEVIVSTDQPEPAANYDVADVGPDGVDSALAFEPESSHLGSAEESLVEQEPLGPDAAAENGAEWALPELIPPEPPMAALPDPVAEGDPGDLEQERNSELSDVSFLRDKRAHSFWHEPRMRVTLVLLSMALMFGLVGQIAFHERDRIAAVQPGLRPALRAICDALNCTLSPLRRIESIVIDSSSFTRVRGDAYRLNFALKNTAASALAAPAIELTLTDSLDQPLVRRVFLTSEFGLKSDVLAAGIEWPASLTLAVEAEGGAERVAGYRLLAFYP
jgi:predicted Zn finger-like uncharacterized protein